MQNQAHTSTVAPVTATVVPLSRRTQALPRVFGRHMLRFERLAFFWAERISDSYDGGLWEFYDLSNGGFYMAPTGSARMHVSVEGNGFEGHLSRDAFGIVASLFAINYMVNGGGDDRLIDLYHQLRDFAAAHAEAAAIFGAID